MISPGNTLGPAQLELVARPPDQPVLTNEIRAMMRILDGAGWMTAAAICLRLEQPATEGWKRRLRKIANASRGLIAGGQKGYHLTAQMTKADCDHCYNFLLSQADEMRQRAIDLQRVFHSHQPFPR